ncbi:type IV conjugative transfer system protein TraL [Altericroceibacterium spongiae]|uniref:Type IV conjugative transfer system protein TraL n=1 Tax=Altericroceibacterium spongiae TaxID=2320269 RepID=A0A420EAI8_9SPHN|nr:type IV conjugative transfer system protein TraL [Altericroceibacterium spongiae]RKF17698.1 type IV conjugative transfer system protein TraL [Altericroceibacterium spongiae]
MNEYTILKHLDDPELIGLWTFDEFLVMSVPFFVGIISGHVVIGIGISMLSWFGYRKIRAGREIRWIIHYGYWNLPGGFFGLKIVPPSHFRVMAG